jgi:hypothetical protein
LTGLAVLLCCASGCAARFGEKTTTGAVEAMNTAVAPKEGQRPAEAVAERVVKGAVQELSDPAEVARLQAVARAAADTFRTSLTEGLVRDLGQTAKGPLGDAMTAVARRASSEAVQSAVQSAVALLTAPCDETDPTCLDRRVADLSDRVAVSFAAGVRRSLGVPALIAAFLAGVGCVLFALGVWSVWRSWRRTGRGRRQPVLDTDSGAAPA